MRLTQIQDQVTRLETALARTAPAGHSDAAARFLADLVNSDQGFEPTVTGVVVGAFLASLPRDTGQGVSLSAYITLVESLTVELWLISNGRADRVGDRR